MRVRVGVLRRSLLLGLAIAVLMFAGSVVKAVVPGGMLIAGTSNAIETQAVEDAANSVVVFSTRLPRPQRVDTALTRPTFTPRQQVVEIDPSNYDYRMMTDINGNPVQNQMIVVIHETVGSASSAINTFRTNHPSDYDQVSYHTLVARDGTVYYLVPPEMRAFGAGNSVFASAAGNETVRLHPTLPPSVNNFSYHVSLETPSDGRGNSRSHSGYTAAQYQSLAWVISKTTIPADRITTHQSVDRSGTRRDPRSFDRQRLLTQLNTFRPA
jgi:N-acetyl-anhydromuramyl-L-alanine amidase AmpD